MSTVRFLRTFVAVAGARSFSEAAERVGLTQAAVSFQMRALEVELGRELFDRSGRLALMNAAGRDLLPRAKEMLDLYDHIRAPVAPAHGDLSGSVAVGAIVSCMGMLSKVVSQIKRDHGALDVRVFSDKSGQLAARVEAGDLDLALVVEAPRPSAQLRWTPLFEEPLVVAAARSVVGDDVRQVLESNPFLRFDRTQRTGLQLDRALRKLNVRVHDFLELNAIETVVELVRQEVGVALLPWLRTAQWATAADLRFLPLPSEAGPVARVVGMIDRRDNSRRPIADSIYARCVRTLEGR
jgi:DNA-binding transcriptional LysR family regulator